MIVIGQLIAKVDHRRAIKQPQGNLGLFVAKKTCEDSPRRRFLKVVIFANAGIHFYSELICIDSGSRPAYRQAGMCTKWDIDLTNS